MCIERQNVFSFFLCLMFFKPQTGPNARGLHPEALNEKAEAFLTVAECHHGRREDTESSVHWKEKIWKILHTRDFHRTIFSKKGRSIPHGGRMSPWSSRGHRILGPLEGKNLKNSAHERLSQDNFLEKRPKHSSRWQNVTMVVERTQNPRCIGWKKFEKFCTRETFTGQFSRKHGPESLPFCHRTHWCWVEVTIQRKRWQKSQNLKEPHFHSPNFLSRSARLGSARTRCLAFLRFSFCICSISWGIVFNLISFHFFFHCWKNMRMTLFWHATRSCSK